MVSPLLTVWRLLLVFGLLALHPAVTHAQTAQKSTIGNWKQTSPNARHFFVLQGNLNRETPLRAPVEPTISQNDFFISYTLKYPAEHIDKPPESTGEFFILWLDDTEGNETSGHSNQTPNIGIHVDKDMKNKYMVRFSSAQQAFASELSGDQSTKLVAHISKSKPGIENPFDKINLWINPKVVQRNYSLLNAKSRGSASQGL